MPRRGRAVRCRPRRDRSASTVPAALLQFPANVGRRRPGDPPVAPRTRLAPPAPRCPEHPAWTAPAAEPLGRGAAAGGSGRAGTGEDTGLGKQPGTKQGTAQGRQPGSRVGAEQGKQPGIGEGTEQGKQLSSAQGKQLGTRH